MAWLGTWAKRIEITPDYTNKIGGSVTWFPIAIIIESGLAGVGDKDVSCIFDELTTNDNRKKIAVTKADGTTELYVEIEQWDDAGENAVLHCSLDGWTIDNDDDVMFIYYDSSHADNDAHVADLGSRTEVWDGNFAMVQHMINDNGNVDDSTSNNNDGTKESAGHPAEANAQIYKGQHYDGSQDYINHGTQASLRITGSITVECWVYFDTLPAQYVTFSLVEKSDTGDNKRCYKLYVFHHVTDSPRHTFLVSDDGSLGAGHFSQAAGAASLAATTWYHIVGTYDVGDSSCEFYINGAVDSPTHNADASAINDEATVNCQTGATYVAGSIARFLDGLLDEVRISNTVRSAAWIKATYHSGLDDLLTYGDEETISVVRRIFITHT